MEIGETKVFVWMVIGFLLPSLTEGLRCYQCNVYVRGTPWPCDSDRGMHDMPDCLACLKTYTRSYLHNTFHDVVMSTYISRVCVRDKMTAKENGCYNHVTASGYMKRCFCNDDLCNHSAVISPTLTSMFGCTLVALVLKYYS